jgi:hypothetical protein
MKNKDENVSEPVVKKSRFGLLQVMGLVALAVIATALLTAWWVKTYVYASEFTPTVLTAKEQSALDSKLARLEATANRDQPGSKERRHAKRPPPLSQRHILIKLKE